MNNSMMCCIRLIMALFMGMLLLTGCSSGANYAPVVNGWAQPAARPNYYIVKKGDTLYSIAWAYGLDYRGLAAANGLAAPYRIHPGQKLQLAVAPPRRPKVKKAPSARHRSKAVNNAATKPKIWQPRVIRWVWPARGRIIKGFNPTLTGNKGIDIAGRYGEPVRAAASGVVVYRGSGLRGYGHLIILKHNDNFLTAYAFNKQMLVRLGQRVKAGQVIATMGRNNAGRVMLHFEIRRNGKPVNPLRYLRR